MGETKEWNPSARALNYRIDATKRYHLNDTLGDIIDDSYLASEKPIIDEYNRLVKQDKNRIFPCAFFELGLQGDIDNALILNLTLNSGFTDDTSPNDIDAFEDKALRDIIKRIHNGDIAPEPHIALLKEVRELPQGRQYPFVVWFGKISSGSSNRKREWLLDVVRKLLGDGRTNEAVTDWLAYHYASRELLFYHTHDAGGVLERWEKACRITSKNTANAYGDVFSPHQKVVIADVKKAVKLRIPIFVSRGMKKWLDYVPQLQTYDLLFCSSTPRRVFLSSTNTLLCKDRENRSDKAKKAAWTKLTAAIMARFNIVSSK